MSIAVFRSDYVTNCAASTSVRFDRKEARNRQLHIFAERYRQYLKRHSLSDSYKVHGGLSADYFFAL